MPEPDWRFELGLVNKFLEADSRNCACLQGSDYVDSLRPTNTKVHGWDYRRHILASAPSISTKQKEFDYTTSKIMSSFSNFSAWHYRSKLLVDRLQDGSADDRLELLDQGR